MENKKLSSEDLIKRYKFVTFFYILLGIISVYLIKSNSWADWANGEMQSNNWEGVRISIWAWYVGFALSIFTTIKDIDGIKNNKSQPGKIMMIMYTIIHLLVLFGTSFGDDSSNKVSWLKWYQIITVFSLVWIYFKIDFSEKK
jgi:predicted membrane channel-forming protein YqfA (hemolysin III family)